MDKNKEGKEYTELLEDHLKNLESNKLEYENRILIITGAIERIKTDIELYKRLKK